MSAGLIQDPKVILEVDNLRMHFPIIRGLRRRVVGYVKAVDKVNLFVQKGETLGLVGESGCGKTTTGRCIIRAYTPTSGEILYRSADNKVVDLAKLHSEGELRPYRRDIRMIFQDPYSSLNPRMTLLQIVGDPLLANKICAGKELEDRVAMLLKRVGLRPEYMRRYPHAFSGGERQRIGIARALALRPKFIVADEPVSALDVSIQSQVLNILKDLQKEFQLTYVFIAHNLSVVEHISDRVAVMYLGKMVELADRDELFLNPLHPYTQALMSAIPIPDPTIRRERIILPGDVPSPLNPPKGCRFHPRCPVVLKDVCPFHEPKLIEVKPDHWVACHRVTAPE